MPRKQCGHKGRCKKCTCIDCRDSGRQCISYTQFKIHARDKALWEIEVEEAVISNVDLCDVEAEEFYVSTSEDDYVSTSSEEPMVEPDSEDEDDLVAQYRRQLVLDDLDEDQNLFVEEQLRSVQKEKACQMFVGLVSANIMTQTALTEVSKIWNEYSQVLLLINKFTINT